MLFRHWDPRVLGALLPVLDAGQFARIAGPAQEIALSADDYGGLKRVIVDPAWPAASSGMLKMRTEQMLGLTERRNEVACQHLMTFLRDTASEQVRTLDDGTLRKSASAYLLEARHLGIEREAERHLWCHMRATCPYNLFVDSGIRRYLADPAFGSTADVRMQRLFKVRTELLRRRYG